MSSAAADPPQQQTQAGGLPAAPQPRPLRRDAQRNRQRILDAAMEIFREQGVTATLDDVAHRAGLGVGTVYRRFPDKVSLVEALFEERIDALARIAERASAEPDPWTALRGFLEQAGEEFATDRGLRQVIMSADRGGKRVAHARGRLEPAVRKLVERAQAAGQLRADFRSTDVPIIEFMLGAAAEYAGTVRPGIWRRYLGIMLDGLRPARDVPTELPEQAFTAEDLQEAMSLWQPGHR
jgi:AcrR family transcriptional regulator